MSSESELDVSLFLSTSAVAMVSSRLLPPCAATVLKAVVTSPESLTHHVPVRSQFHLRTSGRSTAAVSSSEVLSFSANHSQSLATRNT